MSIFGNLLNWLNREEIAIQEWEKRTGKVWLRNSYVKKGGRNGPPTIDRPPPPPPQVVPRKLNAQEENTCTIKTSITKVNLDRLHY